MFHTLFVAEKPEAHLQARRQVTPKEWRRAAALSRDGAEDRRILIRQLAYMEQETYEAESSSDESSVTKWVCRTNDLWFFDELAELTPPPSPRGEGRAPVTETNMLASRWSDEPRPLLGDAQQDVPNHAQGTCKPCIFHNSPQRAALQTCRVACFANRIVRAASRAHNVQIAWQAQGLVKIRHDVHPSVGAGNERPRKETRERLKMCLEACLHLPDDQLQVSLQPILQHPYARGLIRGLLDARAQGADLPLEPGEVVKR
eukprot:s2448_g12.t2